MKRLPLWEFIVDVLILLVLVVDMAWYPPSQVHAQLAASAGFTYSKITTNVCTIVSTGSTQFDGFVVSSAGTAWTIQVFDNATACTGTAIIGATALTVPAAFTKFQIDAQTKNGIAILTAGTTPGELTILYR